MGSMLLFTWECIVRTKHGQTNKCLFLFFFDIPNSNKVYRRRRRTRMPRSPSTQDGPNILPIVDTSLDFVFHFLNPWMTIHSTNLAEVIVHCSDYADCPSFSNQLWVGFSAQNSTELLWWEDLGVYKRELLPYIQKYFHPRVCACEGHYFLQDQEGLLDHPALRQQGRVLGQSVGTAPKW